MSTDRALRAKAALDMIDILVDKLDTGHQVPVVRSGVLPKKRKTSEECAGNGIISSALEGPSLKMKRTKLAGAGNYADRSHLPAVIWHHIFTFCPPRTLGRLLSVNTVFNSYLDPASAVVAKKPLSTLDRPPGKSLEPIEPNDIWRGSRRSFWPNMPGPLREKTELDMWRLCCSTACQFCGKRDVKKPLPASDPLRTGPGADGVACIWEFRARCCGPCLLSKSLSEMDLLLSSASTFLIPALQFVFITPDTRLVPLSIIERGLLPPTTTLKKLFWSADVEKLREEFSSVRELGAPAVEEWQKGLHTRGSVQRSETAKLEKFSDSGGIASMRSVLYPGYKSLNAALPGPSAVEKKKSQDATPVGDTPQKSGLSNGAVSRTGTDKTAMDAVPTTPLRTNKISLENVLLAPLPSSTERKPSEDIEKVCDEAQGLIRRKILKYADEAIGGGWDGGAKVTEYNAPAFAVDVLLHVRKRFYKEVEMEARMARAAGREPIVEPREGPFSRKLSLENMKYVFYTKVQPITSKYRSEVFLCPCCDAGSKFHALEATVQHYAAKHTRSLSAGRTVANWKAEWPEEPPFRENPRVSKITGLPQPLQQPLTLRPSYDGTLQDQRPSHSSISHDTLPPRPPPGIEDAYDESTLTQHRPSLTRLKSWSTSQSHTEGSIQRKASWATSEQSQRPLALATPTRQNSSHPPAALGHHKIQSPLPSVGLNVASSRDGHLPASRVPYAEIRDETLHEIHNLWPATHKLRGVPRVTRLLALLYHANKFFKSRFGRQLPLALFIESIGEKQKMSDIRSIQELPCKTCYLRLGGVPDRSDSMTLFSLPQLLSHFYDAHVGGFVEGGNGRQRPSINWLTDMIIYPQPPSLLSMVSKTKDCGKASQLLAEAVDDLLSGEDGGWQPVFNIYAARKQAAADRQTSVLPDDSTTKKAIRAQQNPNKKTDDLIPPTSQQSHKVDNSRIDGTIKLSEELDKPTGTKQPVSKQTVKYESKEEGQSTAHNVPSKPKAAEPVAEAQSTARNVPSKNKTAEPVEEGQADLLGALEMHLKGDPGKQIGLSKNPKEAAIAPARTQAHERSIDERDRQLTSRQEVRGRANDDNDDWARTTNRRERSPVPPPEHHRPVSRVAFEQFRERSPLRARRYVDETSFASSRGDYDDMYERGHPHQALPSHDNQRYGPPPNRQHYYEDHVDESGRRGPSSRPLDHDRYEVYDIVRVVDPEGDYYVRRPVRREYTQPVHRELDRYESPISADGRVPLRRRTYGGDYYGSGYASPQDSYAYGAHEWDNEMHTPVRETGRERSGRAPLVAHPRMGRDGAAMDKKYNQHIPGRGARIAD